MRSQRSGASKSGPDGRFFYCFVFITAAAYALLAKMT
jgi:hypothetical protein